MEEKTMDVIVAIAWFMLSAYALTANILLVFAICKSEEFRTFTSYWFILSCAVCEMSMTSVAPFFAVSVLLHDALSTSESAINFMMILLYDFFWYSEVVQFALMAFNRFVCIAYPAHYSSLFSKTRTAFLICCCYISGLALSLPVLIPCCYILWDSYDYVTFYDNPDTWYKFLDLGVNTAVFALSTIFYAAVLLKVRQIHRHIRVSAIQTEQISTVELKLLAQFLAASSVYVLTWTTWQSLRYMPSSKWMNFVMMSFSFLTDLVNPSIYLTFNKTLRKKAFHLLCCNNLGIVATKVVVPSTITRVETILMCSKSLSLENNVHCMSSLHLRFLDHV